jgi:hypothetical protein
LEGTRLREEIKFEQVLWKLAEAESTYADSE